MKTLVHSIIWCPPDQPERQAGLEKHLERLQTYEGDFDVLVTINGPHDHLGLELPSSWIIKQQPDNKGWAWARNQAIKMTIDESYDLLCMMDGDIWVEDSKWILKAQKAAEVQPVFMCRMKEPQYMKGGKLKFMGHHFEVYDEWLGCINVARRYVLKQVGGYNHIDLPNMWGFHDCEWGRRLAKAGLLKAFNGYPSLANLGVIEEQGKEYDKVLDPLKHACLNTYTTKFWQMNDEIIRGTRPVYFDYEIGQ